jgi:hypothetical protein
MIAADISLNEILDLIGDHYGVIDSPCPFCSHLRKPANQRLPVFRVWRHASDFASFKCQHCEIEGFAKADSISVRSKPDIAEIERTRSEARAVQAAREKIQLAKAKALWNSAMPPVSARTWTYLRSARGYRDQIPATIRDLKPSGKFPPAMIAAIGIARETEPGILTIDDSEIRGVHLTRLKYDGSGKAEIDSPKIMIGASIGSPIVLAPPNDLLGLVITEGIEDALSVFQATGLGVWAAGSASRMPALAESVPDYIDCVTIVADSDQAGQTNASKLAEALDARGIETFTQGIAP